ncbi:RNA polymerase II mediator complex subunit [Coniochaeta pulveracea]|uniref:Mediator of RNA polymerase II transcription subunit 10 n=1 Tax=Coniochaeta pulveracea TaxID=177199 RepID=A0A420XZW0_9PEZI|nr:RNA polymerase II mediator complex subunit [Coniochaeta pulveracea]
MAPPDQPSHDLVEQQIKDVIQDLFQIMVQVSTYDTLNSSASTTSTPNPTISSPSTRDVLTQSFLNLSQSVATVNHTADQLLAAPSSGPSVPEPLVAYVEKGRNPDIYTREFVELVRRMNQLAKGKQRAFLSMRDTLAREIQRAMPECAGDVDRVVEATGGYLETETDGVKTDGEGTNGNGGQAT